MMCSAGSKITELSLSEPKEKDKSSYALQMKKNICNESEMQGRVRWIRQIQVNENGPSSKM